MTISTTFSSRISLLIKKQNFVSCTREKSTCLLACSWTLFSIFLTYFDNLLFFSKPFNWSNVEISVLINKSYFPFNCKSLLVQSNLHNFRLKRKKKVSDFYFGDSYHRKHVIFKHMKAFLKTRHKIIETLDCEDTLCIKNLILRVI